MKKLLKKAWEKLVGVEKVESAEEIILNRARRRFLAARLKRTKQYNNIKAKYLPHSAPYADVQVMCKLANTDINYLLSVS